MCVYTHIHYDVDSGRVMMAPGLIWHYDVDCGRVMMTPGQMLPTAHHCMINKSTRS